MTEIELADILRSLDGALKVFANHKESLSASEISLKSLLTVLHSQATSHLRTVRGESHLTNENSSSLWREIASISKRPPLATSS